MRSALQRLLHPSIAAVLSVGFAACASVDTIRLTSETFPPKASVDEVEVLEHDPARPYIAIAELRVGDSWLSFGSLQRKILKRAAALGADAVVFSQPEVQVEHEVAYEPVYSPWGFYGPFNGPWAWGYGYGGWGYGVGPYPWTWGTSVGSVAVPYDEAFKMLAGTAIRYVGSQAP